MFAYFHYMVTLIYVFLSQLSFGFAGKLCIEVTATSKIAFISEELCIGCGICVKVCIYYNVGIHFAADRSLCWVTNIVLDDTEMSV